MYEKAKICSHENSRMKTKLMIAHVLCLMMILGLEATALARKNTQLALRMAGVQLASLSKGSQRSVLYLFNRAG